MLSPFKISAGWRYSSPNHSPPIHIYPKSAPPHLSFVIKKCSTTSRFFSSHSTHRNPSSCPGYFTICGADRGEAYITANRALDRDLERLTREKAELSAALQSPQHEDFVEASIRQFCASARARLQACADFDAKRQFLVGHVERVIYNRYQVTIAGSVPVQSASEGTKLPFRIEGEVDRKAVRSGRERCVRKIGDGEQCRSVRPL